MNFLKALFGQSNSISPTQAQDMIKGNNPPIVLDVRQPDEFKGGHIAQAKHIPLDNLASRMSELPKDKTILCVCRSGARSSMAARQLSSAGYTVLNLSGGMMSWQSSSLPIKKGK